MRVAEGEKREGRKERECRELIREREREGMNKIYYFCLQFDEQLVVNMETDYSRMLRGCLVCVFKQHFSVFKQHFTHFNALLYPHVFPQIFSNNNFQFLNTCTKQTLNNSGFPCSNGALSFGFGC